MPKSQICRERRGSQMSKAKLAAIVIGAAILLCLFIISSLYFSNQPTTAKPKAALVDHLSFLTPNSTFKSQCIDIMERAGFKVTYYNGEEVTVDFYKHLPTYGYNLIVLRVHSAAIKDSEGTPTELIGLFTSEIFNQTTETKYHAELERGELARARLLRYGIDDAYFGITPIFVSQTMEGNFEDTVITMMGCEGLNYPTMAEALHQRGAKVYIGWTGPVSISHTDHSTIRLLKALLEENETIKDAVQKIAVDPDYQSELDYYPRGIGDYKVPHPINNRLLNVMPWPLILDKILRSETRSFPYL